MAAARPNSVRPEPQMALCDSLYSKLPIGQNVRKKSCTSYSNGAFLVCSCKTPEKAPTKWSLKNKLSAQGGVRLHSASVDSLPIPFRALVLVIVHAIPKDK